MECSFTPSTGLLLVRTMVINPVGRDFNEVYESNMEVNENDSFETTISMSETLEGRQPAKSGYTTQTCLEKVKKKQKKTFK